MPRHFCITLALTFLGACQATPMLDGHSLLCSADRDCPTGLRCFSGGCVLNTPPSLEPLGVRFVAVGQAFSLTVTGQDRDRDPLTFTWRQRLGPTVLTAPLTEPSLGFTPAELGLYAFTLVADDGFGESNTVDLTVVAVEAPPAGAPIYVSDQGADTPTCGALFQPCATLKQARANRLQPSDPLVVAAMEGFAPYDACLSLSRGESVWGGFAAGTWRYAPELIARTEINCRYDPTVGTPWPEFTAVGHLLLDDAVVAHLTLSLAAESLFCEQAGTATTVLIGGETAEPWLWFVDLIAPAVGSPCAAAALVSQDASPRLLGVNVRGPQLTFDTPAVFIGIYFGGGRGSIVGGGRGSIRLDLPAAYYGIGISLDDSAAHVDGVHVTGGIAPLLYGIEVIGGAPLIESCEVEFNSFGTIAMIGIGAFPCDFTSGDCQNQLEVPAATLQNNQISLHGSSGLLSVPPCLGLGVIAATDLRRAAALPLPNLVADNVVDLTGSFSLAIGVGALGGGATVSGNTVTTGPSAEDNIGCTLVNQSLLPGLPISQAAIGVALINGKNDTVSDNDVFLGPHVRGSRGLLARNCQAVRLERNRVRVGVGLEPWGEAVAAELGNGLDSVSAAVSSAYENEWIVEGGAHSGVGLRLRGIIPWRLANNFIHGGNAPYATGVQLRSDVWQSDWPRFTHNTIFGGGSDSLVSRTLDLANENGKPGSLSDNCGTWINNLFDAGDGRGRRILIEHPQRRYLSALAANIAQVRAPARPRDVPAAALVAYNPKTLFFQSVNLWLPRSGSIATFDTTNAYDPFANERWFPLAGAFEALWMGNPEENFGLYAPVIAGRPGEIGIGYSEYGTVTELEIHPAVGWVGSLGQVLLNPRAVAGGELDGATGQDIAMLINEGPGDPRNGLWAMLNGGAAEAIQLFAGLTDPTHLAVSTAETALAPFARFFIVDDTGADLALWRWPSDTDPPHAALTLANETAVTLKAGPLSDNSGTLMPAVALVSSAGLRVWDAPTLGITVPLGGATTACAASTITALDFAYLGCGANSSCWHLLVGCADGSVQAFRLSGVNLTTAFFALPSASGNGPVSFVNGGYNRLVVGHLDSNSVDVFFVGATPSNPLAAPSTYTILPEVGRRNDSSGMLDVVAKVATAGQLELGDCDLTLREPGADPYDLHLVPGRVDACHQTGLPAAGRPPNEVIRIDLDGEPRSAAAPDVGADERAD